MPHIHDKIDFTAEAFIVHKNKVLLRKHDKYKIWLSVGGHIELDEEPNEAVIREVKEEVGLTIELFNKSPYPLIERNQYKELIPPEFLNIHKINDTHKHISLVYFAKSNTTEIVQSEEEKSDECKWFTKEELGDSQYQIGEQIKIYARAALENLKS
ncbi:MAG: NUDIX domain-containing protein [Nanoarchaeota archaeon]